MQTPLSFTKILLAFFIFIGLMIMVRIIYSGKLQFIFLVWNLFLAWLPFIISTLFKRLQGVCWYKQWVVFLLWFLFFPNALYIVTDLIHLDSKSIVPKWYDALLLFTSSIVGLLMAFVSLIRVESFLLLKFSNRAVHLMMIGVLFFGSFGVYLGRFLRWNSWDIVSNPFSLLLSIIQRVVYPFQHIQTWGITIIFTILFYLLYLTIKKLPAYLQQTAFK